MAGPGNTPYQVGPGSETDISIPGNVGFYGVTPVARPVVAVPDAFTINVTVSVQALQSTLSKTVVALQNVGIVSAS